MTVIKDTNKEDIGMYILLEFIRDKNEKNRKTWIFLLAGHQ